MDTQFQDNLSLVQRRKVFKEFQQLRDSDRVLLLFGAVGVGKSSFVNFVAGERRTEVGNGFYGITMNSDFWDIEFQGRRLRMIDLPGSFDPGRNKVLDLHDEGYFMKECNLMNTEFAKALIYAGPQIHAVGLVVNSKERSGLSLQFMIKLLDHLKIEPKHIVLIATHGDSLLPKPLPKDLRRRCEMRWERFQSCASELERFVELLRQIENRFIVVENPQVCERTIIMEQLFRHIDSIAKQPMTNDTFHKTFEWWSRQTAQQMKEERAVEEAKDKLFGLQIQLNKADLAELRSKHNCLEEEHSAVTSNLGKVRDIKQKLEEMRRVEGETDQCTAMIAAMKEELARIEQEECALRNQDEMLRDLKETLRGNLEEKVEGFVAACTSVIRHREEGIHILEEAANRIDKLMKDCMTAKIAGYCASATGAVIFTVGAGLLLGGITAPAAIPLLAIGGVVGGAGSVAGFGGTVTQLVMKRKIMLSAKKWLKDNKRMCEDLVKKYDALTQEHDHIIEVFPSFTAHFELPQGIREIGRIVSTWKEIIEYGGQEATQLVVVAAGSGLGVAQGVLEGVEAGAEVSTLAVKVAAKAAGGVAVGLSAIVIVLDLGLLIKSSYDMDRLRKGHPTKAAKALTDLAEAVKEETNLLREAHSLCTTRSGDDNGNAPLIVSGNDEQLLINALPDDLETGLSHRIESHVTSAYDASQSCEDEDERVDHDNDDQSLVSLEVAEGDEPSEVHLNRSTGGTSTQSDNDSASDFSSVSNISMDDVPEADLSHARSDSYCIIS